MNNTKMLIRKFLLLFIVFLVILISYNASTAPMLGRIITIEDIKSKPITYVALGDSLTKGYPYLDENDKHGYSYYIYEELCKVNSNQNKVGYLNYGVLGFTSSDLLKQIYKEDIKNSISKADIITISIGGNDFVYGMNINDLSDFGTIYKHIIKYLDNLSQIFSKLREMNPTARIYISNFFNPFSRDTMQSNYGYIDYAISYINKSIKKQAIAYSIEVVDVYPIFAGHEEKTTDSWFYDSIHPNQQGYIEMSKVFVNRILGLR